MEFVCYHRDRPGTTPLRSRMVEQHWSYMDPTDGGPTMEPRDRH